VAARRKQEPRSRSTIGHGRRLGDAIDLEVHADGADVGALADHIDTVLVSTAIGMGLSVIAFIWMVVAIIRLCALPKPDTFISGVGL